MHIIPKPAQPRLSQEERVPGVRALYQHRAKDGHGLRCGMDAKADLRATLKTKDDLHFKFMIPSWVNLDRNDPISYKSHRSQYTGITIPAVAVLHLWVTYQSITRPTTFLARAAMYNLHHPGCYRYRYAYITETFLKLRSTLCGAPRYRRRNV
jgi:hypothetical protein